MIVDAHHHFWNPALIPQPWMTAEHAAINRAFEPPDLEPSLRACGIGRTVLVQSAADDRDTDYMFDFVDGIEWVGAVIAWVQLDDPLRARRRLDSLGGRSKLRGIRHLIHQESDPHWILQPGVQVALELLQSERLLLELPAVFPNHLADVPVLASRYPGLTLVIDHLAKPPRDAESFSTWRRQLAAAAEQPNVVAKISGLDTSSGASGLLSTVATALESFGPARLIFGSDWPVSLLNDSYERVVGVTIEAIRAVAGQDAGQILGSNALRIYRIDTPAR